LSDDGNSLFSVLTSVIILFISYIRHKHDMKMTKICQRLNDKLLMVLKLLSKEAEQYKSFSHITHTVQFDCFPSSLLVIVHCYDINLNSNTSYTEEQKPTDVVLQKLLHRLLLKKGIVLKKPTMNLKVQNVSTQ